MKRGKSNRIGHIILERKKGDFLVSLFEFCCCFCLLHGDGLTYMCGFLHFYLLNVSFPWIGEWNISIILSYSYSRFFRFCQGLFSKFLNCFMPLAAITTFTACNNICPSSFPTQGSWIYMIHCKIPKQKNTSTILTGVFISPYHISPITGDRKPSFWDVRFKDDNGRIERVSSRTSMVGLEKSCAATIDHIEAFMGTYNFYRTIWCIKFESILWSHKNN